MARAAGDGASPFAGRWDITLKTPAHAYGLWLQLDQQQGQWKATLVSRWGNARPLPQVGISQGELTFTSPKDEENSTKDGSSALSVQLQTEGYALTYSSPTTWMIVSVRFWPYRQLGFSVPRLPCERYGCS
jgi:hypothetical protein